MTRIIWWAVGPLDFMSSLRPLQPSFATPYKSCTRRRCIQHIARCLHATSGPFPTTVCGMLLGPGWSESCRSVWLVASCHAVVQGNLNNFASLVACQQACIAGTQAPKQAAPSSGVAMPAANELFFLTSALRANAWLTLDATSVRGSTHRIRQPDGGHCWTCSARPKGLLLGLACVFDRRMGTSQLFSVEGGIRTTASKLTAI